MLQEHRLALIHSMASALELQTRLHDHNSGLYSEEVIGRALELAKLAEMPADRSRITKTNTNLFVLDVSRAVRTYLGRYAHEGDETLIAIQEAVDWLNDELWLDHREYPEGSWEE